MNCPLPIALACLTVAAPLASPASAQSLRDRRERLKREMEAAITAEQWDLARAKKREFDRLLDAEAPAETGEPPTETIHGYSIAQVQRDHPPLDPAIEKKIRDILSNAPVPGVRQMRYAYFGALASDTMGPAASVYAVGNHALLVGDDLIAPDPQLRKLMDEANLSRFRERVLVHEALHGLLFENERLVRDFLALPGGFDSRRDVLREAGENVEGLRSAAEDRVAMEQGADFHADYLAAAEALGRAEVRMAREKLRLMSSAGPQDEGQRKRWNELLAAVAEGDVLLESAIDAHRFSDEVYYSSVRDEILKEVARMDPLHADLREEIQTAREDYAQFRADLAPTVAQDPQFRRSSEAIAGEARMPSRFTGDVHATFDAHEYFAVAAELFVYDRARFSEAFSRSEETWFEQHLSRLAPRSSLQEEDR